MNPDELLRIVDAIHREKNIEKEVVFRSIEAALVTVARKRYGDQADVSITIDRKSGVISGRYGDQSIDPEQLSRIGAQAAKQVILQKIREAERDVLYDEYQELLDQVVTGTVQKVESRALIVSLPRTEAILPKSEQIPGETRHPNERIRAVVTEVKKAGTRLRIVLSRIRPVFVVRLFEQEVPEIADGVIEIKSIAREPGYRTKVAVASVDQRVDCVGACVGLRGNRIRNIVEELSGERIDIIRWDDDLMVLIPNSLQPAKVEEVILCQMLGRAIVLVPEDQLSLAIGRWGQNVRLASKLCGWDIEIMTRDELDEQLEQAVLGFSSLDGVSPDLADRLVGEGFLSYDDLSVIEPEDLMEMGGLTEDQAQHIIAQAEAKAEEAEQLAREEKRRQKQLEREREAARAEGIEGEPPPSDETKSTQEEPVEEEGSAEEASSGLGDGV